MHAPLNYAVVFETSTHNIDATPEGRAKTHKTVTKSNNPRKMNRTKCLNHHFNQKKMLISMSKLAHRKLFNIIINIFIYPFIYF